MNNVYFYKNMAHSNADFFVTYCAIPEKVDFHKKIKDRKEIRIMEENLQSGKMSTWYRARIYVTLLGTDISGFVEVPECSYSGFEDFLQDSERFKLLVSEATDKLERELENESFMTGDLMAA